MRWTDLPNAMVATIWGLLLVSGIQGVLGIVSQHVAGYPATGQYLLYVGFPVLFLALSALWALLSRTKRWFYDLYPFAVVLTAFAVLPVILVWGGGV